MSVGIVDALELQYTGELSQPGLTEHDVIGQSCHHGTQGEWALYIIITLFPLIAVGCLLQEDWRNVHKLGESILQKVGIRRASFEDRFVGDLSLLLDEMGEHSGQAFDPSPLLSACVTNLSWNLCTGQR